MGSLDLSYHERAIAQLQSPSLFISDAFVGGKWRKKTATFPVIEPSSAAILGHVANCDVADFQEAIEDADRAQKKFFASTTAQQRGKLLMQWNDLILAHKADLATVLSLENGKTYSEAEGEIVYATSFVAWFAEEAARSYGLTIPSSTSNTFVYTIKEPVGVCGIITPWNFPAAMITRKIAPALGSGCAVVIKPPSETPYTCLALTKLATAAGIPGGVIQVCPTKNREAALELATNPLVKKISFTGSTGVGKMLAKLAAGTLKKLSLELGGNAPFIVFDDADVDLAVEAAMFSKFRCTGQTCICANRILVQEGVIKEFTEKLVAKVAALKCGPGLFQKTTQGPLVNQAAVSKVAQHVEDAIAKGAKIEIGGKAGSGDGFFFEPTVISNAQESMMVASEETFGPLAAVFSFDTEAEAIRLANATEVGLAGYFFSKDVSRVMSVAQQLQVGMVGANTGKISAAEAPFGGVKESGYGREGSAYGMDEYQVLKTVTIGNFQN